MKQTKKQLLATIEKLKKQIEAIDNEPTILSMEVNIEVAKEDEKGLYTFDEANEINFNGWRIPTIQELEAMYEAKIITEEGRYWSSTENYGSDNAWDYDFSFGYSSCNYKYHLCRVRAVRTIK